MEKGKLKSESKTGLLPVLKSIGFRKLWFSQIFSQLADKFYIVLTVYLITNYFSNTYEITWQSKGETITLLATGIYIANSLPAIIFGALAGIASDVWPKVKVMIISNSLRSFCSILIPICLINGDKSYGVLSGYWFLLVITFFTSLFTQFFTPAEQASIPLLVKKKDLLAANSLYQATTMGATIFGFALGEPLLRAMNFLAGGFGISGGRFLLLPLFYSAASIVLLNIPLKEKVNTKTRKNLLLELLGGINILKNIPIIRNAILQLVILYSLMAALYILAIELASSIPELGPTNFGVLLGFSGFGIAIGAFVVAQKGHKASRHNLSSLGLVLIALCLFFARSMSRILKTNSNILLDNRVWSISSCYTSSNHCARKNTRQRTGKSTRAAK